MQEALHSHGVWQGEYRIQTGVYDYSEVMLTLVRFQQPVKNGGGDGFYTLMLFYDLSQQKYQQLQLKQLAHYDKITGLPNRELFTEKVEWFKQNQENFRFGLLCIDLDGFKLINDQYGREVGDKLLKKVAMRLSSKMRSEDILSRFGGDEFVGLIQQVPADLTALAQLMHRLLQAAAKPIYLDGIKLQVSRSIGVTVADSQDFESVDLLLRQADHAMYQAKM
jgi:diguanylate cyclase (GGDEF)-like protein